MTWAGVQAEAQLQAGVGLHPTPHSVVLAEGFDLIWAVAEGEGLVPAVPPEGVELVAVEEVELLAASQASWVETSLEVLS